MPAVRSPGAFWTPNDPAEALRRSPVKEVRSTRRRSQYAMQQELEWEMIMSPGSLPASPSPRTKAYQDHQANRLTGRLLDADTPSISRQATRQVQYDSMQSKSGSVGVDQRSLSRQTPHSSPVSPVSAPVGEASPVSGFAELEGSPPMPCCANSHHRPHLTHARQISSSIITASRTSHSPKAWPANLPHHRSISYGGNAPHLIPRKPVGSGTSSRTSPTRGTDPCHMRMPERPSDVGSRPMDPRKIEGPARSYVSGGSRQQPRGASQSATGPLSTDAWVTTPGSYPSEEPLPQSDGKPDKPGQQLKPAARAKTITSIPMHSQRLELGDEDGGGRDVMMIRKRNAQPTQLARQAGRVKKPGVKFDASADIPGLGHSLLDIVQAIYKFIIEHVTTYSSNRQAHVYLVYTIKLTLLLYLISGLCSILTGLKDGLLRAFEPLTICWSVLRWMLAVGR